MAAGVSDDQLLEASDDVDVWERAGLPFRADTSNAASTVENMDVFVNIADQNTGDVPANKDELAVYDSDDTVTLEFEDTTGAGVSSFAGEDAQLLVAKLDADHSILDDDYTGLTVSEAIDLVTVPNANNNATFEMIDAGQLDGDGETSINYDLSTQGTNKGIERGSGQYMFFLVQNDTGNSDANDGFEVDNSGQLSISGQTQVIGMDAVAVQSTSATASASDVDQGDSVTIDVDASGLSDSTPNHTLVVYHKETFENARAVVNSPNISRDLEADDIEIEHKISKLNGPVKNAQEVTIGGATIGAGSDSGPVSVSTAIDYLVDSAGTERPQNSLLSNPTELDGAVYTYAGQSLNSVTVDTQDDWKTGDYRYIYIAGGSDSTELATVCGTFELKSDSSTGPPSGGGGGGGGGGGDDGGDDDDDDDDSDTTPPVDKPDVTKEVDKKNGSVKVSIKNPGVNKEFEIDLGTDDEEGDETEANDTGAKVTKLGLNLSKSAENVNVSVKSLDKRPDNITEDPSDKTVGYVQVDVGGVDDDDDVNSARFTFSVSQKRLDEIEAAPEDIVLYRHHDGEWQELETTYLGDGEFEAETPGFSVFAIGTKKQQVTTTTTAEPTTTTTAEPTTMTDEPTTDKPTTDEPTTTTGTGIPGFGATVSVLALIAVVLVALRRD
ncbi:PKD domain containing protein [Haloferax elongans ATCC BAA-1513]|uniref:PKD domain containing protein n=1 Tax=Haloferax elongans ATCC BAA-1513 TaxID=1230453 RepID=M0HE42_HALEO|nr:PKD domain containing protein [Haloferax elongans ATCC BAA-1513]